MLAALGHIAFGLFGLAVLVGIAFLFSNDKRAVSWTLVASGVALQVVFATLVLKLPFGSDPLPAIRISISTCATRHSELQKLGYAELNRSAHRH